MKNRVYFLDNLRTLLIFLVILYHAGFSYQSIMQSNWLVIDSARSDSIGLVGLYIDIFVMAIMFFISGYFIPSSLKDQSSYEFILSKFKRIMVPWAVAVLTLIPLYKVLFLYSRGLPQEDWYTYFHWFERSGADLGNFANNPSQHWLWFLPVLFLFQILYLLMSKSKLLSFNISLRTAVLLIFIIGLAYSMTIAILDLQGWSLNTLLDFQRERLLVYFTFFLLGTLCYKLRVFESKENNRKQVITSNVLLTLSLGIYTMVTINFLLNMVTPDRNFFFVSQRIDGIAHYSTLLLSMLCFLYIFIHTFKSNFNNNYKVMTHLNRSSYYVYIIHMIVLGFVALGLINISLPVGIKYLLLAILTFIISNALVYAYYRFVEKSMVLKMATAAVFVIGFFMITTTNSKATLGTESGQRSSLQTTSTTQTKGLHEAVIQGDLVAVNQHIMAGSDLDVLEPSGGSSPLITAAVFGKPEIATALIKAGANLNLQNNDGSTALHSAAFFCHTEIVEALLVNGADRSIKNNAGATALDSVIGPYETVKGIYDYFGSVLGTLGLELDHERLKSTRPEIAEILRKSESK